MYIILLSGCQKNTSMPISANGMYFDTFVSVALYDSSDYNILNECMNICQKYENMFNADKPDSDIYKINHSKGNAVDVSPDTIILLKKAMEFSQISNGAYDITIAGASGLWDFHETKHPKLPDESKLIEAVKHIDYTNIDINSDTCRVTVNDAETYIEVGSIAKGYIADAIKEYLSSQGIHSAVINMGGDIALLGNKPDGSNYCIGIQSPFDSSVITQVEESNKSIATSGIYERCFEIDDKQYHHILNTKTGYPCETKYVSASVITESAMNADALATVCILLSNEDLSKILSQFDNTYALLIDEGGNITRIN